MQVWNGWVWIGLLVVPAAAMAAGKVHGVVEAGARGDGKTLCTAAIQKAIDAAAAEGGGTVRFSRGTFLSGALRLGSGVTLQLDEGATLLGSREHKDYSPPRVGPDGRAAGRGAFHNLLHGAGLHDVAIRGPGTIDGNGDAFRDKSKPRPKCIYLEDCRNVLVEGVHLKAAGCWMQHYRLCRNVTLRGITVFNHVAFNNDGMNIDSCRDVTIADCRVDSDDDGIVLKSLSATPCRNVRITNCTVSSHCNGLKMGTESGGGFVDISIRKCTVFSPRKSKRIYGRQRGLAGIALEIVDGGRMENVAVRDVDIAGVSVPIFVRLGNRARPYGRRGKIAVGTLRNVRLENITAKGTGAVGCSITGLPGHCVENVVLANVSLGFEGGGTKADTRREVPRREKSYPESTMFGTLPAWGLYCRHVRGLTFRKLSLHTDKADLRHAMLFDDARDVTIDGLDAAVSPGAAAMLRMVDVRDAAIRNCSPKGPVETLLELAGKRTARIVLGKCDLRHVRTVAVTADDVPAGALVRDGGD